MSTNRMRCGVTAAVVLMTGFDLLATPLELGFDATTVVTGREASVGFALHELNEIVTKSAGRGFEVGLGRGQRSRSGAAAEHRIFLGRSEEAEKVLGADFWKDLQPQESLVFAKGNDLFIQGGDELGLLWAVYDFVEDNLNYHWYFCCADEDRDEFESIDKASTVTWRGKVTRHVPGFPFSRRSHNNPRFCSLFRIRNRGMNYVDEYIRRYGPKDYRGWYETRTCGHGFDFYLPRNMKLAIIKTIPKSVQARGNMWEQHPEYFSMDESGKRTNKMQLCFSNPQTRKAMTDSVRLWIAARGAGTYMVGVNDEYGGRLCFCDGCKALEEKYGCIGGPLWDYMLELCEAVKELKDVFITTLAYRFQTQVAPKNIVFPENFVADAALALWDRAPHEIRPESLPDGVKFDFHANLLKWPKLCKNVTYWYYSPQDPGYTWGRMQQELDDVRDAGVTGVGFCDLEGGYEFRDIVGYLRFRYLYDPALDLKAEFHKVAKVKYGPAADEILAYTEALEAIRLREVPRTKMGTYALDLYQFASPDELLAMERLFDKAVAKTAGTPFVRAVAWARMTLDAKCSLRGEALKAKDPAFDDAVCETRARAAIADFKASKHWHPLVDRFGDRVTNLLDEMANYRNLKSDALPPELAKYPRGRVHRVLPGKSHPIYHKPGFSSLPDPAAVCGWALVGLVPENWAKGGLGDIAIGLWDCNAHTHLMSFEENYMPKENWRKDEYRLFRIGRTRLCDVPRVNFADRAEQGLGQTPINTLLLKRFFDTINVDRQYEIWVSMKAEGGKFWPGDTRPDRILVEQFFVVDL